MNKLINTLLTLSFSLTLTMAVAQVSQVPFADPYVLLDGDTYYAYGTHSNNGIEYYTSTDLKNWTYGGLALSMHNTNQTRWFWAPEVYRIGDKYFMYYSANERLYVAFASSPKGPFVQHGTFMMGNTLGSSYCIDSSVFFDDNGKAWMFFVRNNDGNCIWQVQLEDDYVTPIPSTLKKCLNVTEAWENIWPRVVEGPNVVKLGGTYYLTYSANSYESQDYAVGYATATSLQGPWRKYSGNPILRRYDGLVGTGHHSIFRDKEGKLRIVFHAHQSTTAIHPRTMYIGTMELTSGGVLKMSDEELIRPLSDRPNGGGDGVPSKYIDWNVPYLVSARTGDQYPIVYTKTNPTADSNWTMPDFDDSRWKSSLGPIGSKGVDIPEGSAPLGTVFSDVYDGTYNVWFRRKFTLSEDLTQNDVWLACGHDDEGAIYLDGVKLVVWSNEWNNAYYFKLTPEQTSLLTAGDHVLAVWAKNNSGGFYYDCGLYGRMGAPRIAPVSTVTADFSTWEEFPLVKKIGLYQTPLTFRSWLERDLPKLGELEARSMRYEMAWGKDDVYGQPAVGGTPQAPTANYSDIDWLFDNVTPHCPQLIISQGYSPTIINGGNFMNPPTDYDAWATINAQAAQHWAEKGYKNHYIEVWNEPDLTNVFFTGDMNDYLKMYETAAPAIRNADPNVKVGGPAGASSNWHQTLVQKARSEGWPLDFLSGHAYGDPTTQLSTMRTMLNALRNYEGEMLMTEYAPYTTGEATSLNGPVEKAEAAMTFFNAIPTFLEYGDLTHVNWAQYIDPANMSTGRTFRAGEGDKMGLINGNSGDRKALFNAFKLYGMMPVDRCAATTTGEPIHVLASKGDDGVALVVWNTSTLDRTLQLDLTGLPFDNAHMESYRIDATHNSYYETRNDALTPELAQDVTIADGAFSLEAPIASQGVYFIRLSHPSPSSNSWYPLTSHLSPLTSTIVRTRQWYESRTARSPYAYFDPKTWTARLSLNQQSTGRAMVGVEAENLPRYVQAVSIFTDNLMATRANSTLNIRIDYQSANGEYTKAVLYHSGFHKEENTFAPKWGTRRLPDSVVAVDDFHNFTFDLQKYAPADFTGRALITFELAQTGNNSKANIQFFESDGSTGISLDEGLRINDESNNPSAVYDLQGRKVAGNSQLSTLNSQLKKGVYIVGGKKIVIK